MLEKVEEIKRVLVGIFKKNENKWVDFQENVC
jgi:hypothetical protein